MFEAKVKELMGVQYDDGHFEEWEAKEVVKEAMEEYKEYPEAYDNLDDAIDMVASRRMYPEL